MTVPHYVNEHQSDIRAIKSGMEQRQALVRSVSKPGEMPHRNLSAHRPGCGGPLSVPNVEASTSGRALAWMDMASGNGLTILVRPADTNSASKR